MKRVTDEELSKGVDPMKDLRFKLGTKEETKVAEYCVARLLWKADSGKARAHRALESPATDFQRVAMEFARASVIDACAKDLEKLFTVGRATMLRASDDDEGDDEGVKKKKRAPKKRAPKKRAPRKRASVDGDGR